MEKQKRRKIVLPGNGSTIKLVKATRSSYATVWRALHFMEDTEKQRKIRYVAIKEFGGKIMEFDE